MTNCRRYSTGTGGGGCDIVTCTVWWWWRWFIYIDNGAKPEYPCSVFLVPFRILRVFRILGCVPYS